MRGKISLKHLGRKSCDSIAPSLYDITASAFKTQFENNFAYSDSLYRVLGNGEG